MLGLVALGASSFRHDKDLNNPAFKKSKEAFCAALKDEKLTIFGDRVKLHDLFDKDFDPTQVLDEITEFSNSNKFSDIFIYYCGHGIPDNDGYVLALKNTKEDAYQKTGLRPVEIRDVRDRHFAQKRLFLFLDCCYAGKANDQWKQNRKDVPNRGATIACAASGYVRALASGKQLTVFTESFLEALQEGKPGPDYALSLRDRIERTQAIIASDPLNPHPVLVSPDQPPDLAGVPLFVNRGFDRTIIASREEPRITYLSASDGMFGSERKLTFNDHSIVVRLSLRKLELYVDGVLRGSRPTQSNPDPNDVLLESSFADGGQQHRIKVYGKSSTWQGKLKLLLDGKPYGDEF